jgi:hypothetical protein
VVDLVARHMRQVQLDDAAVGQAAQLAGIGIAVVVGVDPELDVLEALVAGIDLAVVVAVLQRQGRKAVAHALALRVVRAHAEELAAVVDLAIAVAVPHQQRVALPHPAHAGTAVARGRQVEVDALGRRPGAHAVAVQVQHQRRRGEQRVELGTGHDGHVSGFEGRDLGHGHGHDVGRTKAGDLIGREGNDLSRGQGREVRRGQGRDVGRRGRRRTVPSPAPRFVPW